jgi:uncharacterized Zn finger protein (UPF0148 family)
MRYRILKWLKERIEKLLGDYCSICGKRLVRYPDGYMDCPDIVADEKKRRGTIIKAI